MDTFFLALKYAASYHSGSASPGKPVRSTNHFRSDLFIRCKENVRQSPFLRVHKSYLKTFEVLDQRRLEAIRGQSVSGLLAVYHFGGRSQIAD